MWILIQKAQCIFRHNIQAFTIQSAVGWILLTLTQFPLILPEAFSGSSLTQKWNVGVHARQFPPPPLMQHNTPPQNVTVFPVSLLARKFFALGTCVSPDSWLAKTCHLGSHSVCFVWCWEHCRWLRSESHPSQKLRLWQECWREAKPAGQQMTYHITEKQTSTTTFGADSQGCNKLSVSKSTRARTMQPAWFFTFCTFSKKCRFHPTWITSRYLLVESIDGLI